MDENRAIGLRLRTARKRAGFTQARVAAALGETQSYVSKVEKGERRADLAEGRAFIKLYNADANEILFPERSVVGLPPGAALAAEAPRRGAKRPGGARAQSVKFRAPARKKPKKPKAQAAAVRRGRRRTGKQR